MLQDGSPDRDVEFATNVNGLLQDPDYDLQWNAPTTSATASQASTSTAAVPQAPSYVVFLLVLPCHDAIYADQPPAVVQTSKLPLSRLLRLSRRWRLWLVHRQHQQVG